MHTCFLLENDATVDALLEDRSFEPGRDIVVCWNYLPYRKFVDLGLSNVFFVEDFFTPDDYKRLHAVCDTMAAAWHTENGQDLLVHDGVSYGNVSEIMLFRYYCQNVLVKLGSLMATVKKRYPKLTHLAHDVSNNVNVFHQWINDAGRFFDKEGLLSHVSQSLGFEMTCLSPSRRIPPSTLAAIPGFAKSTQPLSYRLLAAGLLALNHFKHSPSDGSTYFFHYFNQRSLTKAFSKGAVSSGLCLTNMFSSVRFLDFDLVRAPLRKADQKFLENLRNQTDVFSPFRKRTAYIHAGLDFAPFFAKACRDILITQLPRLVQYARKVHTGISNQRIVRVVANDLMTERGKILAEVCRSRSVDLAFVDHGIQSLRQVHVCSMAFEPDLIVKPNDFNPSMEPYPYNMTGPAIQLGSPITDPYLPDKRRLPTRLKTILIQTFADNFYGRLDRLNNQGRYYAELLPAMNRLLDLGLTVIYRPHNENQAFHDYLFNFFNIDTTRLKISAWDKPFNELIYEVDLLVCNVSTTFYEALAAGVPPIFFDPGHNPEAFFPPLNGQNLDEIVRVTTGQDLVNLVSRNQNDTSELRNWLERFLTLHAPRYLGPLDGGAGRRIGEYLEGTH